MDSYNSTANFHIAVIKDKSLSYLDKIVYIVLCSHADNEARECSPKVATIAEEASCSQRTVHKSLNNLEKHGVVSRKRRFADHRQISSLYKIIGGNPEQNFADENVSNSECSDTPNNMQSDTPNNMQSDTPNNMQSDTPNNMQSLNILRIFNNSLKGEACLPASAEKESSSGNPKETKNSLTGEALLPSSQLCEPEEEHEKPQADVQDSTTENLVIKAECTENHIAEEMGACLPAPAENKPSIPEQKTLTDDEKLRRYYELRRKCEEEHRKAEAEACLSVPAEKEATPEEPKAPQTEGSTLPDYLIQQYEQKRRELNIVDFRPEDTLANGLQKFLAKKPPVIEAECEETPVAKNELADSTPVAKDERIEHCDTPVSQPRLLDASNTPEVVDRHMKADNAHKPAEANNPPMAKDKRIEHQAPPAVKSQPMDVSDPPVVVDGHMNAGNASRPAETSDVPVAREEPPAPKEVDEPAKTSKKPADKGKYSGGGSSKDVYPIDYAPDIMRPTAEYFLFKTGRKGLRWEEVSVLRTLSATQYPTRVNKEIERACERFKKRNQSLLCLTLMYIAAALKNQPTWGSKAKKKVQTPTAEEEAKREAEMRARIEELKEELGVDMDERGNIIARKREDKA